MRHRALALWLPVLVAVIWATPAASLVTMDWIPIGNAGNAADTPSTNCFAANCGSVSYAYRISKYEVTNAQYTEFLNAVDPSGSNALALYNPIVGCSTCEIRLFSSNPSGSKYVGHPGWVSKPVVYVSFYDALRFANWLHNGQGSGDTETGAYTLLGGTATPSNGTTVTRNGGAKVFLPSENEWYKAAYYSPGGVYFDYPAGTNSATVCSYPSPTFAVNWANCQFSAGAPTDVGGYTGSGSPYGTYDQGGNVWEWNEQIVSTPHSNRGVRGGGWNTASDNLAASVPFYVDPTYEGIGAGFRVASRPPAVPIGDVAGPAIAALLVMTGLLGLAYWQRRLGRAA